MKRYSFKKGFWSKGVVGTLTIITAFIIPMFPQFFNRSVLEMLILTFPILKTATIGGILFMLLNYLKIKCEK